MADASLVHSVALPAGAEPPIRVYVNGEERAEGEHFTIERGRLRFTPALRAQPRLGLRHKAMLAIGIGVYGDLRGDTLDVAFTVAGRPRTVAIPLGLDPP